jgi:hypothetical protein
MLQFEVVDLSTGIADEQINSGDINLYPNPMTDGN